MVLKQAVEVTNPDEIPFSFTCKNSQRPWIVFFIFSYTFNSGKQFLQVSFGRRHLPPPQHPVLSFKLSFNDKNVWIN